jgi:glycosyltransferase involved in cell wall biosynthesis
LHIRRQQERVGWRDSLLSSEPVSISAFSTARTIAEAASLLSAFWHDLIFIDEVVMAPYLRYLPQFVPYVVSLQKIDYDFHVQMARRQGGMRRLLQMVEARKLRRFTMAALQHAAAVVLCTSDDGRLIRPLAPALPHIIMPNGVDLAYFRPAASKPVGPPTLLFVGTLSYGPNIDALRFFVTQVYNRITAGVPGVRLLVVGRDPGPEMLALARQPGVTMAGPVDDVRPYYNQATVSVVPLRVGGGSRLKILESFAMNVPVVSTTIGAEGIAAQPGRDIMIADAPGDFARSVIDLLRDASLRERMAAHASHLVEQQYAWPVVAEPFVNALLKLAEKTSQDHGRGAV